MIPASGEHGFAESAGGKFLGFVADEEEGLDRRRCQHLVDNLSLSRSPLLPSCETKHTLFRKGGREGFERANHHLPYSDADETSARQLDAISPPISGVIAMTLR